MAQPTPKRVAMIVAGKDTRKLPQIRGRIEYFGAVSETGCHIMLKLRVPSQGSVTHFPMSCVGLAVVKKKIASLKRKRKMSKMMTMEEAPASSRSFSMIFSPGRNSFFVRASVKERGALAGFPRRPFCSDTVATAFG